MIFLMMMSMLHPVLPIMKHTHEHVVIAHRGDHVSLPENTLAAYASAIKLGVDYIETDVRTAKNGELVIKHSSLSGNEVLPTFKQVLQLCRNKVNIYLDFKDADVKTTYRMICAAGMEKQIVVYANTLQQLKEWNEVAPDMPMMTSVPDDNIAAFLDQYVISAVDGSIGQYDAATMALFKSRGIAVWLDVQQKEEGPATWDKALNEGIQGMQTDHPAALLKYLKQQKSSPVEKITADFYHHPNQILISAHRADHNKYPENSLPAIQQAIDAGIDIVELDTRRTKDGKIVLMHDKTVDRTTNGKGLISELTFAELSLLRLKNSEEHIPTLEEAFKLAKGHIMIDLDFKEGVVKETYQLIKQYHMEKQILFFVYDYKDAAGCKAIDATVPIMPRVHNEAEVKAVLDLKGFPIMHIDESFYTDSLMSEVHKAGMRVWANALGKYDDMEEEKPGSGFTEMMKLKQVNVIQTNYPEELLQFLRKRGCHR